ncbi:MAG: PepSY-associated TM helix domain-containing protein [Gemmatimonadaceae bacterium]
MTSEPPEGRSRSTSRASFYARLFVGVIITVALVLIAVTGIILNHRSALGLKPDVTSTSVTLFTNAMPLAELAIRARAAGGPVVGNTDVDHMDVRPSEGLVKVRFSDPASTEVTLDVYSGKTLNVGSRRDVLIEKLHSGEVLGKGGIFLGDAAAITLILLLFGGLWFWLAPRWRSR